MYNFLLYLLEVAACQGIFCLLYLSIFRNLSFFQLNRFYLLTATLFSFIIPVLNIPFWDSPDSASNLYLVQNLQSFGTAIQSSESTVAVDGFFTLSGLLTVLFMTYWTGVSWHLILLGMGISKILKLVKRDEIRQYDGIKAIHISNGPAFFAFLNYVFINNNKLNLSTDEFQFVINHEKSHIIQKHTLDNLFMELAIIICWFNPLLRIMKKELNNVHEFYADQQATSFKDDVADYSSLILKLSSNKNDKSPLLSHQFSMNNIKKRIIMLNKQKNPNKIVLRYFAIVPCLALLLVMFSFTKKPSNNLAEVHQNQNDNSQAIGNITWKGNTLYSDSYLSEFIGLEKGAKFDEEEINAILSYKTDGSDLASLYMDQGYLFFTVEMKKTVNEKSVDLTFEITEGQVMKIGKVTVKGNKKVATEDILKMVEIKTGDTFSRSKLIASQRIIAASKSFDPEKVIPTPIPNPEKGTVDIEFEVTEK